jgi:hypothetical protein
MGGVVKTEGLYCACADFRSGPECCSIDPVAYLAVAISALYIAVQVWLARYAETTARLIVSTNKVGNGEPIRVMRLQQLASVFAATAAIIRMLRIVGPPEDLAQLSVAYSIATSLYFAFIIASGNLVVIMFRAVIAMEERREPSARERHMAELYSAVSVGGIVAASAISDGVMYMVMLAMGSITLAVLLWHVVKIAGLLRYAGAGTSDNDALKSAGRRTKRLTNAASLFVVLFTGSRVGLILTSDVAFSPAQGSSSLYWLDFFLGWLAWYSTSLLASETVRYAGGPANLARRESKRRASLRIFAGKGSKVSVAPTIREASVVAAHPPS